MIHKFSTAAVCCHIDCLSQPHMLDITVLWPNVQMPALAQARIEHEQAKAEQERMAAQVGPAVYE